MILAWASPFKRFIKLAGPYITDSIVKVFNCSIKTRRFPDTWKMVRVTPIHKKDYRDDISNYQPISILPIASKHVSIHFYEYMTSYDRVLEPIIHVRLHLPSW